MKHNWEYKRLGEFCNFERGVTYSDKDESDSPSNNIILRSNNIDLDTYSLNFSELKYLKPEFNISESKKLKANSILICLSNGSLAHLGKTAFIKDDYNMAFGGFMGLIIPKSQNSKYISYIFRSKIYYNFLNSLNRGANIRNIQFSKLSGLVVPVPPMAVQEQIVAELDKINEVIADCRELLRNLNALEQSLFYDYFGDPITNPKGWSLYKLSSISQLINGRAYKQNELHDEGKYKVIRVGNFFTNSDYYYSDLELSPEKYIDYGDLIFAWSASFGAFIWQGDKVIYHYHIWKVLFDDNLLNKIFYKFLLNEMSSSFMKDLHGIGMMHLTKVGMENYMLPVPPLALQEKFAERIEAIEEQKKSVEQTIAELQTLLDSRMDYWFN